MGEGKKYIRFIDGRYNTLFYLPDGGRICISRPDGDQVDLVCKFIDECHTLVGTNIFHICEFAERMEAIDVKYKPLDYITEPEFYRRCYLAPASDAKRPPYYVIDETATHGFAFAPKGAPGKRYVVFDKVPGERDGEYRFGENRVWGGSLKEIRPRDWGFNLEKIKAVVGRKPKQREQVR